LGSLTNYHICLMNTITNSWVFPSKKQLNAWLLIFWVSLSRKSFNAHRTSMQK
jgi:hypothetical protein